MKIKAVEKEIEIATSSMSLNNLSTQSGTPIYRWKVELLGLDDEGNAHSSMPFVSHVRFQLHETFNNPSRVVQRAPFSITEQGWGSFDMNITVYFSDSSHEPFTFIHDLNFTSNQYRIVQTITFHDVSGRFLDLLQRSDEEDVASDTTKGSKTIRNPVGKRISKQSLEKPISNNRESNKRSKSSFEENSSSNRSPSLSVSPIIPQPRKRVRPAIPSWISHEALAEKLTRLEGDDILQVVELVRSNRSEKAFIDEEIKGKVTFDLYTLDEVLLQDLWAFVNRTTRFGPSSSGSSSSR